MSRRERITEDLIAQRIIAVVRVDDPSTLDRAVDALAAGGVRAIEITMTVPDAVRQIARLVARRDDLLVGVGSVLDAPTAGAAADAGAAFVVSPVFVPGVIEAAHARDAPAIPGAMTPTEVWGAHDAGADLVKVFPASVLGTGFVRAVLAPMPSLRLVPTGGIDAGNVRVWLRAGAVALGVGGSLVDAGAIERGDFDRLTGLASEFREAADGANA